MLTLWAVNMCKQIKDLDLPSEREWMMYVRSCQKHQNWKISNTVPRTVSWNNLLLIAHNLYSFVAVHMTTTRFQHLFGQNWMSDIRFAYVTRKKHSPTPLTLPPFLPLSTSMPSQWRVAWLNLGGPHAFAVTGRLVESRGSHVMLFDYCSRPDNSRQLRQCRQGQGMVRRDSI